MNSKQQQIKNDWFGLSRKLLEGNPDKLVELERLWASEKYQEAYMLMDEFVRGTGINPSPEYREADENFYWLLR